MGKIAKAAGVKKVVLYHPVYLLGNKTAGIGNLQDVLRELDEYMVEDVRKNYDGDVCMSQDLDVYEL